MSKEVDAARMRARSWVWLVVSGVVGLAATARGRALEPGTCGGRFDVQRDKIIRTEESRQMGARYLSELDVGSRPECLRLCCETDACDVFVYEEKSGGSCYLFACGPPEDFRCKFTSHGNFSSGVLAISRRLAELQDLERAVPPPTRVTTSTPPTPPTPPTSPTTRHTPMVVSGRCSRYEFECRHGGECIAVYNACDGVPQCADGSDEAAELRCPAALPRAAPPRHAPPATPRATPPPTPHAVTTTLRPVYQESLPAAVERMPMLQGGGGGGGEGGVGGSGGDRWPHRLVQQQPPRWYDEAGAGVGVDGDTRSHIFSHKGGLLTDDSFPPYEPWPRRPPPPPPQPPATRPHNTVLGADEGEGVWGAGGATRGEWGAGGGARGEWGARRGWPVPPRSDQEVVYGGQMPELPPAYSSQQQTLRDSAKKGFNLRAPPAPPTTPPAPPATPPVPPAAPPRDALVHDNSVKKQLQDKDVAQPASTPPGGVRGGGGVSPAPHRHYADDSHDGLSEHPPAAVLLLVLGVLMTAATGGMAACRAGAARRRLRRGKSPFAHDADYLVNGMYL